MLKRSITYEDFNGNQVTDVFYFNISKSEIISMQVEYTEGFAQMLEKIIEAKDQKELVKQFKEIILLAYGEKSDDGKRFIKNDTLREEFSQTAAFNALFMELATDDGAAVIFMKGVFPKDMSETIDTAAKEAISTPSL